MQLVQMNENVNDLKKSTQIIYLTLPSSSNT
jgi:hypothetical protein